jgi:hypothetical protein
MSVLKVNQIQTANGVIMANLNSSGANIGFQLAASLAPAFSVYKYATGQSFTSNTPTKVTFDVEQFDTNNNFASSTFTPTVAGYYQINAGLDVGANTNTLNRADIYIYKNGSIWKVGMSTYSGFVGTELGLVASCLVYCNGTTDYIEVYVYATGTSPTVYTGAPNVWFQGFLARSA